MTDDDQQAFSDFAADRTDRDRYTVESEPRPHHDGKRIRIYIRNGAPATVTVLRLIRAANVDGWRLDKHSDHGDRTRVRSRRGRWRSMTDDIIVGTNADLTVGEAACPDDAVVLGPKDEDDERANQSLATFVREADR